MKLVRSNVRASAAYGLSFQAHVFQVLNGMPELPEVEVIARGLAKSIVGKRIVHVATLWPTSIKNSTKFFVASLEGATVADVSRRAKLLLVGVQTRAGSRCTLAVHLKMTGRMVLRSGDAPSEKHDRVTMTLDSGESLVFSDMRRFGYLVVLFPEELENWKFYKNLGPEPLEMDVEEFVDRMRGRRAQVKSLLLNQQMVAGVGNIYADESLFRAGIHPRTKADKLSRKRLAGLFHHLQGVLRQAIQENGSSFRDYRDSGGNAGSFQNSFQVYGRVGLDCVNCGQKLRKTVVSGRTSTYCPQCQK